MPWPVPVRRQFEKLPPNPSKADFHGPYNKLLHTVFPVDTKFTVTLVPQYCPQSRDSAIFIVTFEVMHEDKTVFILDVKPPGDRALPSRRAAADRQVREHIADATGPSCSLRCTLLGC